MHVLFDIGDQDQYAFHRCASNEYNSIVQRHVVPQIPCTQQCFEEMLDVALQVGSAMRKISGIPMSHEQVIQSRPPRMRKRYTAALLNPHSSRLGKSFLKFELTRLFDGDSTKAEDEIIARLIQFFNSTYTLNLARYTIPAELALKSIHLEHHWNYGLPITAKGLNYHQRAQVLWDAWNQFNEPVAHLIDHSKFDSMVNYQHYCVEVAAMMACFDSEKLLSLYQMQESNKFVTQGGIKYSFPFRRCSGVPNTSLGNSIINYCILRICYPNAAIIVDGDDSVVITSGYVASRYDFKDCGMNTKYSYTRIFEHIEFCQSRPVMTPIGYVMCRNPFRAINRMKVRLGKNVDIGSWLWTVGIGEGLCNGYMPILSYFCKRMRELGRARRHKFKPWTLEYRTLSMSYMRSFAYPTDESRGSFALAWGIDVPTQYALEKYVSKMVLLQ